MLEKKQDTLEMYLPVVAETQEIAREAVKLIEVEYDILEPLSDMKKLLIRDAPLIHPKGNLLI